MVEMIFRCSSRLYDFCICAMFVLICIIIGRIFMGMYKVQSLISLTDINVREPETSEFCNACIQRVAYFRMPNNSALFEFEWLSLKHA